MAETSWEDLEVELQETAQLSTNILGGGPRSSRAPLRTGTVSDLTGLTYSAALRVALFAAAVTRSTVARGATLASLKKNGSSLTASFEQLAKIWQFEFLLLQNFTRERNQ